MTTAAQVEALEPAAYYDYYLNRGVRLNGRSLQASRPVSITLSPVKSANSVGSALAVIGRTRVLGSSTLQVGTPDLSAPSHGELGKIWVIAITTFQLSSPNCVSSPHHLTVVVKVSMASFLLGTFPRQRSERAQLVSEHIREALLKLVWQWTENRHQQVH